jgi:Flp pilus assembly protein TadG
MSRHAAGRGQALVELALVLPLLLVLLMGVVDVGRIVFMQIALRDAAQEGATYAAFESVPASTVGNRVRTSSNAPEVTAAAVTIACTVAPAPGTVTVTVSYDLPLITPLAQVLGATFPLSASSTGTNFQSRCP